MRFPHVIQGSEGDNFGDQVVPIFPVGQKMELPDGRVYRYAEAGELLVANTLQESEVPTADWVAQAVVDWAESGHAVQIGDTMLQLHDGTTAITKAQEGSVILEETADLGAIYFIKEQRVTASNETVVFLKDGVQVQVKMEDVGANVLTFVKNPWMDITQHDSPQNAFPCGIPSSVIASGDWGWIQTKGICSCLVEGIVYLGYEARPGETTDGTLTAQSYTEPDDANQGSIARVIEVAPTTEFGLFNLFLE